MTFGTPFPRYPLTTYAEQDIEAQIEKLKAKEKRALKKLAFRRQQALSAVARGVPFPSPSEIKELQLELDEGRADADAIQDVRMSALYPLA